MSSTEKAEQTSPVAPDAVPSSEAGAQRIPLQSRGEQASTKSAFTLKVEEDRRVAAEKRAAAEARADRSTTPVNDAPATASPNGSPNGSLTEVTVTQARAAELPVRDSAPAEPEDAAATPSVAQTEGPQEGRATTEATEAKQVAAAEKPADTPAGPVDEQASEKTSEKTERRNEAAAAKNEKAAARETAKAERAEKRAERQRSAKAASDAVRERVAQVIRVVTLLIALVLAVAALLVALRHSVNEQNVAVQAFTDTARFFDGPFNLQDGVFAFTGKHALIKEALLNWGIAAVVYLIVGRVLARLIRP